MNERSSARIRLIFSMIVFGTVGIFVKYIPLPSGEKKLLPIRPRPAVCDDAHTTVPSAAPASASSRTAVFVDGISSNTVTAHPFADSESVMPFAVNKS